MVGLGDEFYLGDENFDGTPEKGKFAVGVTGQTTVKVQDAAGEAKLVLAIEDVRPLIMGQVNEGSMLYRCRVIAC